MNSPCYNIATKTDCPRRCGGCQVNCPDWAKYVSERDKIYTSRRKKNDSNVDWVVARRFDKRKKKK